MNNKKSDQDKLKHTLRNMRKKADKTIEQLAEELGVSRQTISNWESGKSTPDAISFMNFVEAYDPSLDNIKSLLKTENDSTEHDELSNWGRKYCDLYKKTGSTFFDKTGPTHFYIDEFLDFVKEEVQEYLKEKDPHIGSLSAKDAALYLLFNSTMPPHELTGDIDFNFSMIELGLRLRRNGYIVNTIDIDDEGLIGLVILDDEQRKQLDSIILEHMLIPAERLKWLSPTERFALKDIQSEYDRLKQTIKDLQKNKLEPILAENDFNYRQEFVLAIGHRTNDSNITTDREATIYTAHTLEQMEKYIYSIDERIKELVDNKNTFFVLTDNSDDFCLFEPVGNPIDVGSIKLYRVNCYPDEDNSEAVDDK